MTIDEIRALSKEEFEEFTHSPDLYEPVRNSKSGWITIKHSKYLEEHSGYTDAFGEGLSLRISNRYEWYVTSVIQKINWEEAYFTTMKSKYFFEFTEDTEKDSDLRNRINYNG